MARLITADRWRTVDIITTAVIGVVCGVAFWVWSFAYSAVSTLLTGTPAASITIGFWMLAGVVAALIVRRPGAALFAEFLGGLVETLLGDQFGMSNVYYAALQGLGAELAFAFFAYKLWGTGSALLGGALAAVAGASLDIALYYPTLGVGWKAGYLGVAAGSGAVLAGAVGLALVRSLARTGVLAPFRSGRTLATR